MNTLLEGVAWFGPFVAVFGLYVATNGDARRKRALYRRARARRRALEAIQ